MTKHQHTGSFIRRIGRSHSTICDACVLPVQSVSVQCQQIPQTALLHLLPPTSANLHPSVLYRRQARPALTANATLSLARDTTTPFIRPASAQRTPLTLASVLIYAQCVLSYRQPGSLSTIPLITKGLSKRKSIHRRILRLVTTDATQCVLVFRSN